MPVTHTEPTAPAQVAAAPHAPSILLFAAEAIAARMAQRIAFDLKAVVTTANDERRCMHLLQHRSFNLVLLEEVFAQESATDLKSIYALAPEAFLLEVNFGTSSAERVIRQVRAALHRRDREYSRARHAAMLSLQQQLGASMTGLLLESQLALRNAGPEVAPALEHLVVLAETLCEQLRP